MRVVTVNDAVVCGDGRGSGLLVDVGRDAQEMYCVGETIGLLGLLKKKNADFLAVRCCVSFVMLVLSACFSCFDTRPCTRNLLRLCTKGLLARH